MLRTALLATIALPLCAAIDEAWRKPFPAHRVVGNLYYVGTSDLACFLITTPEGHMLINTGLADSVPLIRASVQSLGFKFEDIKMLLTMQAHFDHVAGMAEVKRITGAKMIATEGDAPVLEDGGKSDFHFGKDYWFAPVKVDRVIKDGEKVRLGGTELTTHLTPGHTKGSVTYSLSVADSGRVYRVLIANMGSINPGVLLAGNKKYPGIAEDYARTFRVQKALACDVFVCAHASMYQLQSKYRPGAPYDPKTFVDPDGYKRAVAHYEKVYLDQLDRERTAAKAGYK
jgi:metallo-beta-lactamase class B